MDKIYVKNLLEGDQRMAKNGWGEARNDNKFVYGLWDCLIYISSFKIVKSICNVILKKGVFYVKNQIN